MDNLENKNTWKKGDQVIVIAYGKLHLTTIDRKERNSNRYHTKAAYSTFTDNIFPATRQGMKDARTKFIKDKEADVRSYENALAKAKAALLDPVILRTEGDVLAGWSSYVVDENGRAEKIEKEGIDN